ncbi:uncharacterized protein B0H64DRAFT_371144 [Chaetomium fimeti]|uniref:CFEM domain-containing protein n=1 Tax=Chaetomium fimeti TaxID=1854472 RepID=A0AAE0HLF1_9PEZI|nr:hypothetical protein B0H64DRAFT_371144 [Chaetomium fimeti]
MRVILGLVVGLLAAVVPLVSAQDDTAAALQALPKCAADCLVENVLQSDCAKDPTPACVCTNGPLQREITLCVAANCTLKQALEAKNATSTACGVPVRDRALAYDMTSIVLASISCSIVLLRVGFKVFVTRSMSSDDYVVALLVAFAIPSIVIIHVGLSPNGVGRDIWTLTPDHITSFLFYFYIMAMLYFAQVMLVKLSMLLFYLRIFPSPTVRRLLWGTVIFNILFGVIFFFVAIFQCAPISYFWNGWDGEHEGMCLNKNAIAWANAAISIALDFWMLAIPLAQLKALNLHWKKKIGVALMFVVGTFVTVVSIIRLHALVTFAKSSNATWDNFPVSLWSTVEINVGIMCTCMPTLRLLLVRLFPALGGSTSRGYGYGNAGGGGYYSGGKSGGGGYGGKSNSRKSGIVGGGGAGGGAGGLQSGRHRPLGNLTSTSHNRDLDLDELEGDGGGRDGARSSVPGSTASVDSVAAAKPMGIVRHQTFAVQYDDDDEASLVEMTGLEQGERRNGLPFANGHQDLEDEVVVRSDQDLVVSPAVAVTVAIAIAVALTSSATSLVVGFTGVNVTGTVPAVAIAVTPASSAATLVMRLTGLKTTGTIPAVTVTLASASASLMVRCTGLDLGAVAAAPASTSVSTSISTSISTSVASLVRLYSNVSTSTEKGMYCSRR